jgi:CheY-like chemotaxis protein
MKAQVLVADDSVTIQKVIELTLARAGVELIQAQSAEEAMRKAKESKPDLMLIDHSMPDQSGQELCAALRQDPQLKDVPIILMAAASAAIDEAAGRRAGATAVVTKPFESQTLIDKVKQLLLAPVTPGADIEPLGAPLLEAEVGMGAGTSPGDTALVLDESSEELGQEMRIPAEVTGVAPQEVMTQEQPEERVPTYDLPVTEREELMLQEAVPEETPSVQTPEMAGLEIEDMAAAVGIEMPGARTREERVPEPQRVREGPAAVQALTVPPELVETLARAVAERVATHLVRELRADLLERVDRLLWEVVPDLAEQLITQEIQRIRDLVEGKQ